MEEYDVIIAGASFAGLAVASKLKGKVVLLIDRKEIGTGVASACGTTVRLVKEVKCEKSILQTLNKAAIHTKNKEIDIKLPEKYCTIDYEKFCKILEKKNDAKFLKANVKKTDGKYVYTDKGKFKGKIIVDCTGWRAVLASSLRKNYVKRNMLSFGIETEIPCKKDDKLRFFLDEDIIKNGVAWLFPCGKKARFGVGSYKGKTNLFPILNKFVSGYGLKVGEIHGGYFCYCLKKPVVKNIFVAGCAAGQTLPLTGEGIRRSVYFGLFCGKIIRDILDKKISLKQGQEEYKKAVSKYDERYKILLEAQKKLPNVPDWEINIIARLLSINPVLNMAFDLYKKI